MSSSFKFDHFDWIAPLYDKIIPPPDIDRLVKYAEFPANGKILDLGGGTGRVTRQLIGINSNITIADSSFGMLRIANHTLKINLTLCQAENLPFTTDTFERILLIDALHHVVDARRTLQECMRVLKRGGLLIIQEPDVEQWGGRLIAIFEKILLMRSHLLTVNQIRNILSNAIQITIQREKHQYWIVCQK